MRFVCKISLLLLQLTSATFVMVSPTFPFPSTCPTSCGGLSIEYPFGIGPGCFRPGFELVCNDSTSPPKLLLGHSDMEVNKSITAEYGSVFIKRAITTMSVDVVSTHIPLIDLPADGPYSLRWLDDGFRDPEYEIRHLNLWVGGCSAVATLMDPTRNMIFGGCTSLCLINCTRPKENFLDGYCRASCRLYVPPLMDDWNNLIKSLAIQFTRLNLREPRIKNDSIIKAFFSWNYYESEQLDGIEGGVEVALGWLINDEPTCEEAKKNQDTYACLSSNSDCFDAWMYNSSAVGIGYFCHCSWGFHGNPYVPNGCQDINECDHPDKYVCNGVCINSIGSYSCTCPEGAYPDPIHGGFCTSNTRHTLLLGLIIGMSTGIGILLLATSFTFCARKWKIRKHEETRRRHFRQNHGLLLQKLLSTSMDTSEKTRIFALKDLEKATNNFDDTRILGRGGHGMVYKGILSDQRIVAIKKSKIMKKKEIDQFINEVVILSQINHRHVVKLFGCCLETEVPLLVYEFISNGTLFDHLHNQSDSSLLPWDARLRIATEAASALSYLHSAASISIFHRDVKSSNILLDDYYTAKVADFGASRSMPHDQTHVLTAVQGTFGYLDPEYYQTGQLTQKSDVYSFGVILVELLTGKKPVFYSEHGEQFNLSTQFLGAVREECVFEILETCVVKEGSEEELNEVILLAEKCLRLKGDHRPTMKEVEFKLQRLRKIIRQEKYWSDKDGSESLLQHDIYISSHKFASTNLDNQATQRASRNYSMENEIMSSLKYAR